MCCNKIEMVLKKSLFLSFLWNFFSFSPEKKLFHNVNFFETGIIYFSKVIDLKRNAVFDFSQYFSFKYLNCFYIFFSILQAYSLLRTLTTISHCKRCNIWCFLNSSILIFFFPFLLVSIDLQLILKSLTFYFKLLVRFNKATAKKILSEREEKLFNIYFPMFYL